MSSGFLYGLRVLFKSRRWLSAQVYITAKSTLLSFFSLTLLSLGASESDVMYSYAFVYGAGALLMVTIGYKWPGWLSFIGVAFLLAGYFGDGVNLYVSAIGVMIIFAVGNVMSVGGLSSLQYIAQRYRYPQVKIIAMAGIVVMIVGAVSSLFVGYISSLSPPVIFLYASLLIGLSYFPTKVVGVQKNPFTGVMALTPDLKVMLRLNYFANSLTFMGRYFVVPSFVMLVFAGDEGGGDAFRVLGVLLAFVALLGLVRGSSKSIGAAKLMTVSYVVCSVCWAIVGASYYFTSVHGVNNFVLGVAGVSYLLFEIVAKLWAAGYLSLYRQLSVHSGIDYDWLLQRLIAIGAVAGACAFMLISLSSEFVNVSVPFMCLALMSLVYVACMPRLDKKR